MGNLFSSPKAATTPPPEKIGQITPQGTTEFGTIDPITGEFIVDPSTTVQRTTESPEQEQLRKDREAIEQQLLTGIGGNLQTPRTADEIRDRVPFATQLADDLPEFAEQGTASGRFQESLLQEIGGDFGKQGRQLERATFQRGENLLQPDFEQQRAQLEQQLADKGIPLSSKAGQDELNRLERSQGSQRENLALSSVGVGRAEQDRLERLGLATRGQQFGEQATRAGVDVQESGIASQQRAQTIQERDLEFQRSLQKQLSLANLEAQQRAQQVSEVRGSLIPFQPTPIGSLSAGSTGPQAAGPGFELLGTLGGAAIGASDINLKENIEFVGKENGHNIYEFEYKDKAYGEGRFRGVMAQDVEKTNPKAVMIMANGFKAVFYDMIGVKMERVQW